MNEAGSFQALNRARNAGVELSETAEYSPFSDEYIVRTQRFPDGQQEVVAFSTRVQRHFQELRLRPRGMRGKREALHGESGEDVSVKSDKSLRTSIERSKRMIRQRCKAIRADRMLTLSTRANETRIEVWAKWWDAFRRRLSKLQDFHYVAVLERQKRGAWHIHIAVNGRQNWNLLRSIWLSVIAKHGTDGVVNDSIKNFKKLCVYRKIGGKGRAMRHLIATYIAKYCGKGAHDVGFNKKRYWTSRGIALPELTTYAHLGAESGRGEAVAAAYECVDANGADFSNVQTFWNRGIGVFWMATGNTDT
ncbi:rolling circle replication-associated protein [Paraburkholderia sp. D1E]|uniref:rolling circle replication-associated protein n=1 Tax=Paraburkholderia sp. D1E TaxID=3461398 RepID=UPI0040464A1D